MKNRLVIITLFLLVSVMTFAQQKSTGIVKLRGTRLTHPLINKWIAEFKKEYPDISVFRKNYILEEKFYADYLAFAEKQGLKGAVDLLSILLKRPSGLASPVRGHASHAVPRPAGTASSPVRTLRSGRT